MTVPLSARAWQACARLFARITGLLTLIVSATPNDGTPEWRARDRHRRIALSALASASAKVISVSTGLISVPLTLHYLGVERYGMWMTMSAFAVVFSFADLGMGNGILNAVSAANGRDDRAAIRQYVAAGYFVLSLIAIAVACALALAYPFVSWPRLFNVVTPLAQAEAGPAMAVFILCFALNIPMGVVQRVQFGLQQGFRASLWQCAGSVLGLLGVLLVIFLQGGLPWLVLAIAGAPLLAGLLNGLTYFSRSHRDLAPRWGALDRSAMSRISRIGGLFLVLQIAVAVGWGADNILIAQLLGPAAVAAYAVPEKLFSLVGVVLSVAMAPLWPAYREAMTRGDQVWVRRTLIRSLAMAAGVSTCVAGILFVFGEDILHVWIGPSLHVAPMLLLGFATWKIIEALGTALAMFLNGAQIVKPQIIIATIFVSAGFSVKFLLIPHFGIEIIPWVSSITYIFLVLLPYAIMIPLRLLHRPPEPNAKNFQIKAVENEI